MNIQQSLSLQPGQKSSGNLAELDDHVQMGNIIFNPIGTSVAVIELINEFIYNVFRSMAVPLETLVRRGVGENHYNLYLAIGGTLWLTVFATGLINIPKLMGLDASQIIDHKIIFFVLYVWFVCYMIWQLIIRRQFPLKPEFSGFDGKPLFFIKYLPWASKDGALNEPLTRQIYEPLLFILTGFFIAFFINPPLGSFVILSGIAWVCKEYVYVQRQRQHIIKIIDGQLIAKYSKEVLTEIQPSEDTANISLAMPPKSQTRESLKEVLRNQDDAFSVNNLNDRSTEDAEGRV